ncbi:uncharacterized protein LOC142783795 isoform X2 [Rhipicephalus microplus]|uniref:uncharacterized protein LOC142783795 isoform X2 n=1 Tax=Rhipicephalus microplus TaxID=6941 RepID=UPI003F6B3E60
MNYNRNQQRPGNVINEAQAVNPQAANRNPLNHVAEAKDNTIQSLRNENAQLKRCIAEQRAQMQEMNVKLNELVNAQQQQQQVTAQQVQQQQVVAADSTKTPNANGKQHTRPWRYKPQFLRKLTAQNPKRSTLLGQANRHPRSERSNTHVNEESTLGWTA